MTYPDALIKEYIQAHFASYRPMIEAREDAALFRANKVIWTPTVGVMDRTGAMHYCSPGYLPPSEFLSVLRIGRARSLMAWTRSSEAAEELELAASTENSFAPEALYWLGIARFLTRRSSQAMFEAWDRLTSQYPDTQWAKRVYAQ